MPCYCDIPDSKDQEEIQNRCKTNMYFDVQSLMTKEQIEKSKELGISKFPGHSTHEINERLCKLCSILDSSQMDKIPAIYYQTDWKHKTLNDWYIQHCKDDLIIKKST